MRWTEHPTGDDEPTYHWRSDGRLFYDRQLREPTTNPTSWIVEIDGMPDEADD